MFDALKRGLLIGLVLLVGLSALLYAGDYVALRFQIPAGRTQFGQVTRNVLYVIHVKGGKVQFEPGGQDTDQCVHSLFPHMGDQPCWYLTRHPDKLVDI